MEITWRVISGERLGEGWGKGTENKQKWQVQNRQGEVKYSVGNGETKELIRMTHGHELKQGNAGGWSGGAGQRGIKGRKKWDNCNNTINEVYFLK